MRCNLRSSLKRSVCCCSYREWKVYEGIIGEWQSRRKRAVPIPRYMRRRPCWRSAVFQRKSYGWHGGSLGMYRLRCMLKDRKMLYTGRRERVCRKSKGGRRVHFWFSGALCAASMRAHVISAGRFTERAPCSGDARRSGCKLQERRGIGSI